MTDHPGERRLDAMTPRATAPAPDEPSEEPLADLQRRWLPSEEQVIAGIAVLNTVRAEHRDRFIAVVPLAQPGKEFGFWLTGQQVVCLPGVWLGENVSGPTAYPLRTAQAAAEQVAQTWLEDNDLTGTVAVAMIHPDGTAAVFESILPAASGA